MAKKQAPDKSNGEASKHQKKVLTSQEKLHKEIDSTIEQTATLIAFLKGKLKAERSKTFSIHLEYQKWYSRALKIIELLGKDRLQEFKSYYEPDPKRKTMGYGSYAIQDYLKGIAPNSFHNPNFDCEGQTLQNLYNQYTILNSVIERLDTVLRDVQTALFSELQDTELNTARRLARVNLRSSGVIAGVVLESHLEKVVANHDIKIPKKNPTLSDFNEALKGAEVYDTTIWRKISYLGDIRNICAHKKENDPTIDQVEDLINGVHWATKNIY